MKKIYLISLALLFLALLVPALIANKGENLTLGEPGQTQVESVSSPSDITASPGKPEGRGEPESSLQLKTASGSGGATLPTPEGRGKEEVQQLKYEETGKQLKVESQQHKGEQGKQGEKSIIVMVAVLGKDKELLYGPKEVKVTDKNPWGFTALGALEATGLPYVLSTRFPGLVESVAGQPNKGTSGWMYKVNEEVPMVAAGQKTLNPGDKVIWWYSTNIASPAPRWEDLVKP